MLNLPVCTWIYLNLPEFTWIYLKLPETTWSYLKLPEITWNNLKLPGFTWIYLKLLEFTWVYLNLPEFTWIYLNLPAFTCIEMNLPKLTWIQQPCLDLACLGRCEDAMDAIIERDWESPERHLGLLALAAVSFRALPVPVSPYPNIQCRPSVVFFIRAPLFHNSSQVTHEPYLWGSIWNEQRKKATNTFVTPKN